VEKINYVKYGWTVHDVVGCVSEWCVVCAQARAHEVYKERKVCLACCNVIEAAEEQPAFQIERFIKEDMA
jgi:hypothetical protein